MSLAEPVTVVKLLVAAAAQRKFSFLTWVSYSAWLLPGSAS